jgi:hypothetical protein
MAITLLADVNIEGHVAYLVSRMQAEYWREVWDHLELRCLTFPEAGLTRADSDATVWHACQQNQFLLLTSNRNDDGPDPLESTIRKFNTGTRLPVFTLSDADEIFRSKIYAENVVEALYDYLLRIETVLGSGRLFLP